MKDTSTMKRAKTLANRGKRMRLSFEESKKGHQTQYLPEISDDAPQLPQNLRRDEAPRLPEMSEIEVSRHYTTMEDRTFGVNDGSYLLGSCTMKYNPKLGDLMLPYLA